MGSENVVHQQVVESTAVAQETMKPQRVPVNVYETPGALVIVAPLPAVQPDDVTVELRPGRVRFYADVRSAGLREYVIHEWGYGGYEREVELPEGYGSGLEASLANGQLAVRVLRGSAIGDVTVRPVAI